MEGVLKETGHGSGGEEHLNLKKFKEDW